MPAFTDGAMPRAALFAVGLIAAAAAGAGHANATEEIRRGPYQKFVRSTCPENTSSCRVEVLTVGNDRRLEITSVSCRIQVALGAVIDQAVLGNQVQTFDFFVPTLTSVAPFRTYTFNAQTLFLGRSGDSLAVGAAANGEVVYMSCKLAGEMVVLG
jgi:hypothetical protein